MEKPLTEKGQSVKKRMIETTSRILREEGFKNATTRAIAEEAQTNIAAIRYYFGSKEALIGAALEYMMHNFESIVTILDDTRLSPEERLKRYILAYFNLARQHPALFRSISNPSSIEAKDTYFIYLNLLHDQCWDKVVNLVQELTGYTDKQDLELKSMQIFSAIEFPIILESNRANSFISQYTNPSTLERYTDILLHHVKREKHQNTYLREILHQGK